MHEPIGVTNGQAVATWGQRRGRQHELTAARGGSSSGSSRCSGFSRDGRVDFAPIPNDAVAKQVYVKQAAVGARDHRHATAYTPSTPRCGATARITESDVAGARTSRQRRATSAARVQRHADRRLGAHHAQVEHAQQRVCDCASASERRRYRGAGGYVRRGRHRVATAVCAAAKRPGSQARRSCRSARRGGTPSQ